MISWIKILFPILIFGSCQNISEQSSGNLIQGFHENKLLSYQYFEIDGKRHGVYKEYYPSGKIQIERFYNMDTIISEKIWDINHKILVNYVIKEGRYYGLLGSSSCMSVLKTASDHSIK